MSDRIRELNKRFQELAPASEATLRDEIATLRTQLEQAEARVAELESEIEFIGGIGSKLTQAATLRKQAEAVEALRDSIKDQYPLEPFGDLDEYVIAGMKEVYTFVEKDAQRLRQQADELEKAEE